MTVFLRKTGYNYYEARKKLIFLNDDELIIDF